MTGKTKTPETAGPPQSQHSQKKKQKKKNKLATVTHRVRDRPKNKGGNCDSNDRCHAGTVLKGKPVPQPDGRGVPCECAAIQPPQKQKLGGRKEDSPKKFTPANTPRSHPGEET